MKKRLRELCQFLERRYPVEVSAAPSWRAAHPLLLVKHGRHTVELSVSGSPSDKKRDALNTERRLKGKFRALGVKLERRT